MNNLSQLASNAASSADPILDSLLDSATIAVSSHETTSVRQFIGDYRSGRFNFNLPFQRKPQWKQNEKSAWIRALLKQILMDPLSISRRGRERRGINGGNRARATVDYEANRFPMDLPAQDGHIHHYWFSAIPPEFQEGRHFRFHHTLTTNAQERLLDTTLHLNVRIGLTDQEEYDWYVNMNKNQKSHTKGQLLIVQLCQEIDNQFVIGTLDIFPVLKRRIQMPAAPNDETALGTRLADMFEIDPNPMDERDEREDVAMALANYTNLLANGTPYNAEFKGVCDPSVLRQNVDTLIQIFDGMTFSEGMRDEFAEGSSSKKQFISRIWSPAYLLGPICWSIGNQKENVVHVWRSFLARCVPKTIASTYLDETDDLHLDDAAVRKYKTAWEKVLAQHV